MGIGNPKKRVIHRPHIICSIALETLSIEEGFP